MSEVIPDGWRLTTIDEIAETYAGGTPNTQILEYWENGDIPWMSSGEVHNKRITHTHQRITTLGYKNSSAKFFPEKTVLIALAGQGKTRGTVAISEITLTTNQSIAGIVISDQKTIPDYVFHNLDSRYEELRAASGGSGRAGLNLSIIGEQSISLPPLPEQQKIATILSSVDDVIEKTRAQIDKLKDLKTGMMQELLTQGIGHTEFKDSPVGRIPASWKIKTIGDLLEFKNGLNKEKEAFGRGSPIINFNDVFHRYGIVSSDLAGKVTLTSSEKMRFSVQKGDVFFTRTSETPKEIGMSAVLLENIADASFSGFVLRGRPTTNKLDIHFCKYCFSADYVRSQIVSSCSYTTRALTNGSLLSACLIAIPPKAEQASIAISIDSVIKTIAQLEGDLAAKKLLKKALMQDLLTGKVRVKVDHPETATA